MTHRPTPVELPTAGAELKRRYQRLTLRDVFLSFSGYRPPGHPVHRAIANLSPGDPLQVRQGSKRRELLDRKGTVVGQLATNVKPPPQGTRPAAASVFAIATWHRELSDPKYQNSLKCDSWEVVIPELVFEPDANPSVWDTPSH